MLRRCEPAGDQGHDKHRQIQRLVQGRCAPASQVQGVHIYIYMYIYGALPVCGFRQCYSCSPCRIYILKCNRLKLNADPLNLPIWDGNNNDPVTIITLHKGSLLLVPSVLQFRLLTLH